MQQDKQGTAMNTISQWTANKLIRETLTISGQLATVFLKIAFVHEARYTDCTCVVTLILLSQQV